MKSIKYILCSLLTLAFFISSGQQLSKGIRVYFTPGTLNIKHSKKELDILYYRLDSLIKKNKTIMVISLTSSKEIAKDKFVDVKKAQTALEFFVKNYKIDRGLFFIPLEINLDAESSDFYIKGESWVTFEALVLKNETKITNSPSGNEESDD